MRLLQIVPHEFSLFLPTQHIGCFLWQFLVAEIWVAFGSEFRIFRIVFGYLNDGTSACTGWDEGVAHYVHFYILIDFHSLWFYDANTYSFAILVALNLGIT